jgi:cytochrome c biogenesis protein CcdA
MLSIPLLLTVYAGFTHAFEADHLLAVSNIISQRDNVRMSVKDGIYWGLGHASTIFCIGLLMIAFRAGIPSQSFIYLEAVVGVMLVVLAVFRLYKFFISKKTSTDVTPNDHATNGDQKHSHPHGLAYGVGLIHGLAGSGALILVVMTQMKGTAEGLLYLVIFGLGCILGMMLASGLFSVPLSKKIMYAPSLQTLLIIISSTLCFLYGGKLMYENLFA